MKKPQTELILDYINEFGSITQKTAYDLFGCMRLGARIHDLRSVGHDIETKMETKNNRFGVPTTYARYYIDEEAI